MASEAQRVPTFPVWVGNLKDTVREKDLLRVFAKHGQIANCKVMEDNMGQSRCFGFVNFYNEVEAERAATAKQGFKVSGVSIKTKGPRQLSVEGHFTKSPPKPEGILANSSHNYRPLTDCAYFVSGKKCTKGGNCPYRHSETARTATVTCRQWMERSCQDINCPYRHPGGKEKTDTGNTDVVARPGLELMRCGGRCGNGSCAALFASREDLSHHIKMARLHQCRHCRAIFITDVEFREHKKSCGRHMNSGSTDVSSDSLDIEQLSYSDSTDTESDEEDIDANYFSRQTKLSRHCKSSDPLHKSASANVIHVSPPKRQPRDRRSSESGTKSKREQGRAKASSPLKTHKLRSDSSKASNFGTSDAFMESFGFETRGDQPAFSGVEGYELSYDYSSSESGDSEEEEDEGDEGFSPIEMTRLLSLNDHDMYESGGEGEEYGKQALEWGNGSDQYDRKEQKRPKHDGTSSQEALTSPSTIEAGATVKSPHRVKLEPVGVFWDIENCPVPPEKSAFALAAKMRRVFFEGKREAEFMCVCDVTKESKEVTDALHKAQVTVVHVNAIAKNAADDKLRQSLRRFAHTYPAPSTVVLISGDINFSSELTDLRHVHNITIVLVHNPQASEALKVFAHTLINFNDFLQDVEPPHDQQSTNLPRVVVVNGLPKSYPVGKLSQRLSRLSDNCGGKVLTVNPKTGSAKILFWTPELAVKAMKRITGENVYGSRITTSLEAQAPPHAQKHASQQMRNLSGPALSKTFPPPPQPSPPHHPLNFGTPRPQRPPPMSPPHPYPPLQNPGFAQRPQFVPQPSHIGPRPPHMPLHPPRQPLLSPPHQGGGGRFPPIQPGIPPALAYGPPPNHPLVRPPLHSGPPSKIHGPQGKILIFRIPAIPEVSLDQLNGHVVGIRLEACIKAEHLILWHNLSELEVLLTVDLIQTASAMKEDMIKNLCEKNKLRKEIADAFMVRCTESIQRVSRSHQLPWEVTVCGWSLDEEEERIVRSQVVALLRRYPPYYWTKWNTFKQRYSEVYSSAISEMAIHNACRGAVQILGNPGNSQNQVIIFYELSPLLKVVNNQPVLNQLQKNFIKLLNSQPEQKIKLLDFVRVFRESNIGFLPVSSSGKLLQEVITTTPNVSMVGVKPSNIYVTLGGKDLGPAASTPQNLPGISAAFVNLLCYTPSGEIPLGQFQQEYQTFYHKSFRVSDYLSGSSKLRDLLEKCSGLKLKDFPLVSGGIGTVVCLDDNRPSSSNDLGRTRSPSSSSTGSTTPAPPKDVKTLSFKFRTLLSRFPNNQLPVSQFQQEFQTLYRHSFRVSDYLPGEDVGLKDLLLVCEGIKVVNVTHANGKTQAFVCRSEDVSQPPPPKLPPSKFHKSASNASVSSEARVSPTPESIPTESVELFKKECIEVLSSIPDGRVLLSRYPEAYYKCKGQTFALSRYKAKKIALLVQAIPDVLRILGEKEHKVIELITDTKNGFEMRVQKMLYSQPNHSVTLDRFVTVYEKHSGVKLTHFCGHSKLIKLLEDIPDTVIVKGGGASRLVQLHPRCVFVMDMAKLVGSNPGGLLISKVVPSYKEMFGKDLNVGHLGYNKLIRALESMPNVVEIHGEGASRKVLPKRGCPYGPNSGTVVPSSPAVQLPPLQMLADEIIALLMTTFSNKLSLIQLTVQYNNCFRQDEPKVAKEQLLEAIKKLPNFKVIGSGTTIYVQQAQTTPERGGSKAKRKTKTSESKEQPQPEPLGTTPELAGGATAVEKKTPLSADSSPVSPRKGVSSEVPTTALTTVTQPAVVTQAPPSLTTHQTTPALPPVTAQQPNSTEHPPVSTTSVSPPVAQLEDSEKESKRLFSETRRLLQLHCEHAMTLAELVERFKENAEPSQPSMEKLYQVLTKHNVKDDGQGSWKPAKVLQISYIPSSVGDSVIQLGVPDCFWKLSMDLAYLFVFHPTPTFSMSMADLESCYADCYGRKLTPAVYAAKSVQKLFTWKQVAQVIKFNSGMCHLTPPSCLHALASLLSELLFTRGGECTSPEDLLDLYQQHFGVPLILEHFGVKDILSLVELRLIKEVVKLAHVQVQEDSYQVKPVLTSSSLLAEQLRHLLSLHDGCVPIDQVESIYTATFGIQTHINITDLVERNKIIQAAPSVVNVIGNNKWLVWAPTGRPYPSRGRKTSPLLRGSREDTSLNLEAANTASDDKTPTSSGDCKEMVNERAMTKGSVSVGEDTTQPSTFQLQTQPFLAQSVVSASADQRTVSADGVSSSTSLTVTHADVEDSPSSGIIESSVDPVETDSHKSDQGEVNAETYGFLEKALEPELMAELRASGEQHQQREQTISELLNTRPLSEQAIQLLIHFAKPMSEIDLEANDSDSVGDQEVQTSPDQPLEPIDYLQTGMTPDQVLEEMRKLKEHSGGYLSPEKMEPFLTYFGELSSRELDRLESLEEAEKPKPKKGAAKKKRVMAIRFPGKSPAPPPDGDDDPYKEQRLYSAELLKDKLPAAPDFENMSDSSDSDGECPRPLEREEYIQTLLKRGILSLTDEEIMRAAQVVDKSSHGTAGRMAGASSKGEWPSLGKDCEMGVVSDLPKPLLPPPDVGDAAPRRVFADSELVLDHTTHASEGSNGTEWPYM